MPPDVYVGFIINCFPDDVVVVVGSDPFRALRSNFAVVGRLFRFIYDPERGRGFESSSWDAFESLSSEIIAVWVVRSLLFSAGSGLYFHRSCLQSRMHTLFFLTQSDVAVAELRFHAICQASNGEPLCCIPLAPVPVAMRPILQCDTMHSILAAILAFAVSADKQPQSERLLRGVIYLLTLDCRYPFASSLLSGQYFLIRSQRRFCPIRPAIRHRESGRASLINRLVMAHRGSVMVPLCQFCSMLASPPCCPA